jgi:hypothetical protein
LVLTLPEEDPWSNVQGDMVTGWIVSISLFVICGCVALLLVRIVNYLDRATSMAEDVEVENPPHDEQKGLALADDIAMSTALASAVESREVDEPLVSFDAANHIESGLDAASYNVHEGETSPDRGAGLDIPDAPGRNGSRADGT